jgi:hypothetical protein
MTARERIENEGYEDVIIYDNPSYDDALIGITNDNRAVYDYDKMIEWLVTNEDMDYDEAADFICWNDSFYYGEGYPLIIHLLDMS